jgi:hypothetical protein
VEWQPLVKIRVGVDAKGRAIYELVCQRHAALFRRAVSADWLSDTELPGRAGQ